MASNGNSDALRGLAASVAIAACAFGLLYASLYLLTGYHPIESFVHALRAQKRLEIRPHGLGAAASNIYHYSLASGFIAELLGLLFLLEVFRRADRKSIVVIATAAGALTLLAVEATGLLDYEAQRVWLFLQPLTFVPVALKLASLPGKDQTVIVFAQWLVLATIGRSMIFVAVYGLH